MTVRLLRNSALSPACGIPTILYSGPTPLQPRRVPLIRSVSRQQASCSVNSIDQSPAEQHLVSSQPALPLHVDACAHLGQTPALRVRVRRSPSFPAALVCFCAVALSLWLVLPTGPAFAGQSAATSSGGFSISGAFKGALDFALHLDKHLGQIIAAHGQATYVMLFAIVFAETGLVLTPFLPGDSLLFAAGAFSTPGSYLSFPLVLGIFIAASILGDAANYAIGSYLGQRAMSANIVKDEYITKTEAFYTKYGGKTIVLARFVPIVRTFAPFVAGVAKMSYGKFAAFNVGGAVLWVSLFTGAGYYFGNLPFVKENFTLVILAIVFTSVAPVAFEIFQERRRQARLPPSAAPA